MTQSTSSPSPSSTLDKPFQNPRTALLEYAWRDDVAPFAKAVVLMLAASASTGDGTQIVADTGTIGSIEAAFRREFPDINVRSIIQRHVVETLDIPVDWGGALQTVYRQRTRFDRRKPLSVTQSLAVFDADGYRCRSCGTRKNLTVDHVIPWSKGGGDEPENLQTLCRSCNARKGDRL